jgi:hypothetical protein
MVGVVSVVNEGKSGHDDRNYHLFSPFIIFLRNRTVEKGWSGSDLNAK